MHYGCHMHDITKVKVHFKNLLMSLKKHFQRQCFHIHQSRDFILVVVQGSKYIL